MEDEILALYDDAQLYDDQNADVTEDLEFWAEIAQRYSKPPLPIIELGAGTGRVSLSLADLGYPVQGIDLSNDMLNLARKKAADMTPADHGSLEFVLGDVRTYQPETKVPLVLFPYNSLSHLVTNEDLDRCLQNIHSMLEPGGRFVFSVFVPLPHFLVRDPEALFPVGTFRDSFSGKIIDVFESMNYNKWTQVNAITWYFFREGSDEPHVRTLSLRMFYPQDIEYLLKVNGFTLEQRFGDFDFSLPDADSVVQAIIAQRNE